jgi:hypothetical protein
MKNGFSVEYVRTISEIPFPPIVSFCVSLYTGLPALFFSFNRSLVQVRMRELRYRPYLAECCIFFLCQTLVVAPMDHGVWLYAYGDLIVGVCGRPPVVVVVLVTMMLLGKEMKAGGQHPL